MIHLPTIQQAIAALKSQDGIGSAEEAIQVLEGLRVESEQEDYTKTPEYQAFVEELAQKCTCTPESDRPCAGLLAGGLCDDLQLGYEPDVYDYEERQSHVLWGGDDE